VLSGGKHSSLFWCSIDGEEKSFFLTSASEMERRYLQRQIELGEEQLAIVDKLQPGVNLIKLFSFVADDEA
jgi:hypothetical protein